MVLCLLQDLYRFCVFALLLQLSIFFLYITKAGQFYHGPKEAVERVVNVFIAAVPTGLATVLVFCLGTCVRKLRLQQIDLLQPEKIKTIADVEVVCFDKTGTLTRSVVSNCLCCCVRAVTTLQLVWQRCIYRRMYMGCFSMTANYWHDRGLFS